MALRGGAFLALWNDVEPGREAEYERWHETEHVPERVFIPGMLAAGRYVGSTEGTHRFLTLYDAQSLDVFASPAYLAVAARPTAWSHSMRTILRGLQRVPCTTLLTTGRGLAAHALAVRFAVPRGWTAPDPLPPVPDNAFHLGEADSNARFPMTNAAAAGSGRQHVLIIEAGSAADLPRIEAATLPWLASAGALDIVAGRYALISALRHDEVDPALWTINREVQ